MRQEPRASWHSAQRQKLFLKRLEPGEVRRTTKTLNKINNLATVPSGWVIKRLLQLITQEPRKSLRTKGKEL